MNVVVVYESLTGNTRRAAELIGQEFEASGATVTVCPITNVDHQAVSTADLVVVGTWVDGLILLGQKPGRAGRLQKLPMINGKKCAVFCTYAIDAGKTLQKLTQIMERRGGDVLGGLTIRRDRIEKGARDFVARVLDVVSV